MKIIVSVVNSRGYTVDYVFPSIRNCAKEMEVDPRPISAILRGTLEMKQTPYGTIVKVEDANREADSAAGTVREYPAWSKEDSTVGPVAVHRGWGRVEQAMVKVAGYVQRLFGQLC